MSGLGGGQTGPSILNKNKKSLFTRRIGTPKIKDRQNTKFVNANRIEFVDLMEKYVELLDRVKNNVSRPIPNVDFYKYLEELNQQRSAVNAYITEKELINSSNQTSKFKRWINDLKSVLDNNDYDIIRKEYIDKYINNQIQIYMEKLKSAEQAIHHSINTNKYTNTNNNVFEEKYGRYLNILKDLLTKFNLDNSYLITFQQTYNSIISNIRQHYNKTKFRKNSELQLKSTNETIETNRMLESIDLFINGLENIKVHNGNLNKLNNTKLNNLNRQNNRFRKIPTIIKSIEDKYVILIEFFNSLPVVMQKRLAEQFEAKKVLLISAKEKYEKLYTDLITNLYNKIFTNISDEINRIFDNINSLQNLNSKIDKINELVEQIKKLQQKSIFIKQFWDETKFSNRVNNLNLGLINTNFIPFINSKIRALGNSIKVNINKEKENLNRNYDHKKRIFIDCLNTFMSQIEGFRQFFNKLRTTIGRANNSIKNSFSNKISRSEALGNINALLNTKLRNLEQKVVEIAAVPLNNDVVPINL